MFGLTTACEALDDDHAAAAARTRTRQYALLIGRGRCGRLRLFCGGWSSEQLARSRDVGGTVGFGKQPVVANAVKALGQDVDQEPADELVGCERHRPVASRAIEPVILVLESDAVLVGRDEAAIGDGDAVGVARQIAQDLLGPGERLLQ